MGFLGVNPRRNTRLDAVGKPRVALFGIPAPFGLPSPSALPGSSALEDLIVEFNRRRERLGPRLDREALVKHEKKQMDVLARDTFGTDQQPLMLLFGESLYSAFIPDLMSPDDRQAFINAWATRGFIPVAIEALKKGGYWTYELGGKFKADENA
jgi:hypothetical protein